MEKVIIIGGGLAGLLSSIQLAENGVECLLIEKKEYPFHRVCGEYISNEAVPFLRTLNLYPGEFSPPVISRLQLSSVRGKSKTLPLELGGFGISRFTFDEFLYRKAKEAGVKFLLNTSVESVEFSGQNFHVKTSLHDYEAEIVIGSYGKRSNLDVRLERGFIKKRSPYVGVKYHLRTDHPYDLISLHNFNGGYCGISCVENDKVNLCYLIEREKLKPFGNIREMEKQVLYENPFLKSVLSDSDYLFEKAETINEISFETKSPVEKHILMAGDSAGMITPLCGNGMAIAIHTSRVVSSLVNRYFRETNYTREMLEKEYARTWQELFSRRLWIGRKVQQLFGSETASDIAIRLALYVRPVAELIIRNTHGKPF